MLILSQSLDAMVNIERIHTLSICNIGKYERGELMQKKFRILAWYGTTDEDCWGIGDYETENRAKEVLAEIGQKYGEYLHRPGGPAILRGSSEVPEAFWVLPKLYEMPEV